MKAPTDLELMAFADGELDDARAEEVAAWLAEHDEDAANIAEFESLGALVETAANDRVAKVTGEGFDVAGDVMAAIERLDVAEKNAKIASSPPPARVLSMRPAAPTKDREARTKSRRRTFVMGAGLLAAAAIAAASLVYMKVSADQAAANQAAEQERAREAEAKLAAMTASPVETPDPSDDHGIDPPTAVDTVDFGAHQGAIFYVPSGASTSTTVVWIAEDEGGK